MKRVFQHPAEPTGGKKYYRSLEELAGTPGFEAALEREFPQGAAEFHGGEVSRRHFMKIMGASTALAGIGLSGCRRPEMHLVPFTKSVEWVIPGKFLFYTSSMPAGRGYVPLIVSTYEGRPTKIEGNPYHPINGNSHGGTDLYAQSS
ncbi:MAG: TAT-variant-translocated molybdopterin oxidoreductase, partial [Chthoniobacteraceae bacterium]